MISYGKEEWVPQMKTLWQDVFGDSEAYVNSFFAEVYKDENTLVYIENETVVAILFMVVYTVNHSGTQQKCVYLYALATEPAYRGKKIMTQMVEKSIEISKERGYAFSVLIPASASLFEYYRKLGYQECAEAITITKSRKEVDLAVQMVQMQEASSTRLEQKSLKLMPADARQIWEAYKNSHFYTIDGIVLSEQQNQFYMDELKKEGGEAFVFNLNRKLDGYVLLKANQEILEIYETNVDSRHLKVFYRMLTQKYSFHQVIFHQPICFSQKERAQNKEVFAMALSLQDGQSTDGKALKAMSLGGETPAKKLPELFINRVLM